MAPSTRSIWAYNEFQDSLACKVSQALSQNKTERAELGDTGIPVGEYHQARDRGRVHGRPPQVHTG